MLSIRRRASLMAFLTFQPHTLHLTKAQELTQVTSVHECGSSRCPGERATPHLRRALDAPPLAAR